MIEIEPSVFGLAYYTDTDLRIHIIGDELFLEALFLQFLGQRTAFLRRVAQLVLADDIVSQTAFAEITQTDRLAFLRLPQLFLKPFIGEVIDHEHRLAVILPLLLFGGHLPFRHLDVVFLAELLEGVHITALFDLHDETDCITTHAATETFVYTFGGADGERTGLLVMERTESDEVRTAFAERHVVSHHLFDLRSGVDTVYDFFGYHGLLTLPVLRNTSFGSVGRAASSQKKRERCSLPSGI